MTSLYSHLPLQMFRTLLPRAGSNSCSPHAFPPQFHMTTVFKFFQRFSTLQCKPYKTTGAFAIHVHNRDCDRNQVSNNTNCLTSRYKSSSVPKMSGKGPGLIVFDLDCTLWPFHVDTTVNLPFVMENSKVVDQNGETMTWYPEVPQVLEYLKSEGYAIAAASRTTKPPDALKLLEFFDWNKYFSYKEIYPGSKVTHFAKFVEQTKVPHCEMLFFDDEQRNIADMKNEGVKCVLVTNGVNMKLVKDSIQQFKDGKL
ncbi:unnamed protein product [Orchesella dallaii]|uniref:Magnesium-dependent phosphatase 1 n=1 Tax=Orchesella dallaii TaxID=48710 RepID=A0ABP1RXD7_9HEXA